MPEEKTQQSDKPVEQLNRLMLKIKYSFYSTLVFFLFANPETFRVMQDMIGRSISITTTAGVPTASGFFLHTALFFVTMLGLMLMPSY
jgi:hypothetical protein